MLNNTAETMSYQQRYHKRNKERYLEKGKRCYEENSLDR